MKKTIAKVGVAGIVVLGITECHMVVPGEIAIAEEIEVQSLTVEPHFGIVERFLDIPKFERLEVVIHKDVYPWLDPEIQDKQIETKDLKKVLRKAGFEGYALRMAQAIIQLESTRKIYAHNDNPVTGDNSYGLFQINMFRGLEAQRLEEYDLENNEALFNPLTNARVAFKISGGGQNWSAWTTYSEAKKIVGQFSS